MPILIRLIIVAVVAFGIGAATTPLWLLMFRETTTVLGPFSILSFAILALSIGYAIRSIRRPPPRY